MSIGEQFMQKGGVFSNPRGPDPPLEAFYFYLAQATFNGFWQTPMPVGFTLKISGCVSVKNFFSGIAAL